MPSTGVAKTATSSCIVELSRAVVKWVNHADERYKRLQRIDQLAQGLRSYALSKRLQGSDHPGMRILWNPLQREVDSEKGCSRRLLVWFVSSHDRVSRCVSNICRFLFLTEKTVLLDPLKNSPENCDFLGRDCGSNFVGAFFDTFIGSFSLVVLFFVVFRKIQ